MSDVKITDLPAASSASNDDVLILVDVDADVTKKISKQDLFAGVTAGKGGSIDSAAVLSIVTAADLDMAGNKVLFGNVYPTLSDLPNASSYHGMFAHVHATGGAYFAHAGNWIQLTSLQNIVDSADGVAVSGELKIGDMVISSDGSASGNTVLRADSAGNVGIAVPDASTIASQLEVSGTGITATHLETTQSVVFNNLPSSDPANAGQLWNDAGTLKISAG
jgi:hypothetical protein